MAELFLHFLGSYLVVRLIVWALQLTHRRPAALLIAPLMVLIVAYLFDQQFLMTDLAGAVVATATVSIYRRIKI